jgi:carboxypeptidase Taq
MADALEQLKSRLADIHSLNALSWLLDWDQRTTMPPGGRAHRADHAALLQRLEHERLIDPEIGRLLD